MKTFPFVLLGCVLSCAQSPTFVEEPPPQDAGPKPMDAATCPATQMRCGSTCLDVTKDPNNCGMCARKCGGTQICSAGKCSDTCMAPLKQCGQFCVNLDTDHDNCGMCGKACALDQECTATACVKSCPMGLVACDMTCANLTTDHDHCGDCNTACAQNEICTGGICCAAGKIACNGACTDVTYDPDNCGQCGFACGGQTPSCANGKCVVKTGRKCQEFKNNGSNYQQFCWDVNNQTVCIGQTSGGQIACQNTSSGIRFTFDLNATWPMRFTLNQPQCQNYHPQYLQNLATALGYTKYTVNQTKTGNSCTRTYLDGNLMFQSTSGDSSQAQIYDINFD